LSTHPLPVPQIGQLHEWKTLQELAFKLFLAALGTSNIEILVTATFFNGNIGRKAKRALSSSKQPVRNSLGSLFSPLIAYFFQRERRICLIRRNHLYLFDFCLTSDDLLTLFYLTAQYD